MHYSGFADEAADSLADQIAATKALGWTSIESRKIDRLLIHDLPDDAFDRACGELHDQGITIDCIGSAIANWQKSIEQPMDDSLAETKRCIARMHRLGTQQVRIMSFALRKDAQGKLLEDQFEHERFRRLRELHRMFTDAGLQPVHENCMNYGGISWEHTLRLVDNIPGLRLVFDTGNPTFTADHTKSPRADGSRPMQSSWEFYRQVRDHIARIHIKDGRITASGTHLHTWPGEGDGDVRAILTDLLKRGYQGAISIEPHLAVVHHDPSVASSPADRHAIYVEYGRRVMALVDDLRTT